MTETKDLAVLDLERFEMLAKAIGPALEPIIASYIRDCNLTLETLPPLVEAGDHDQVRSIAHRMKGASSSLGLLRLEYAFRELESSAALKLGTRPGTVTELQNNFAAAKAELGLRKLVPEDPR